MLPELEALNALRETRSWRWPDTAAAMASVGCRVSSTTLQRLYTDPSRPPRDRTLHKIRTFLTRAEGGLSLGNGGGTPTISTRPPAPPSPRFKVGDTLPLVLTLAQFAAIWGVSVATVRRRRRQIQALELEPYLRTPKYSGPKVQRWLDGEPLAHAPTPALPAPRRRPLIGK